MRTPLAKRKATLVDVARAAGVGPMTVSRTINGHPYVSEATAKRVHAAIRKLGYSPNHAARMLTGQLSRSIGLIIPDVADPFFSVVSAAVQQAAREAGYTVWLAISDNDVATEQAEIEQMTNHPVDGILLAPIDSNAKHLKRAASGTIPIVTIDRPVEIAVTDSVEVENRAGAVMAVEHLRSHGCKSIVCVATDFHLRPVKQRIRGYQDCLRRAKLPAKKIILKDEASASAAMKDLFSSKPRPDALFTTNNLCTISVIQALQRLGIRIGRDVAVVGFDDVDFYTLLRPPMTTVGQPVAEVGRTGTRLLLSRIRGSAPSSSARITLPVSLVVRESCGCK